jgi:MFS family permease
LLLGLLGLSTGPMYPGSTVIMQNAVKLHQLGIATGTLNFFRLLGGAVIVAAFGTILLGAATDHGSVMTLDELRTHHVDFVGAFRDVFIAGGAFLAVALACVLAVDELPMRGPAEQSDGLNS